MGIYLEYCGYKKSLSFWDYKSHTRYLKIFFSMPSFFPLHVSKFIYLRPVDVGYLLGFLYDMLHSCLKIKKGKMKDEKKNKIIESFYSKLKNKRLTTNFLYKNCSIQDDEKTTKNNCKKVGIPEAYVDKKINEYKRCLKKKKTKHCETNIEYSEIQNKRQCERIIKNFFLLYLETGVHKNIIYFFHGILSYLWCSANNKEGILQYYTGLKQFDALHNTSYFKSLQLPSLNTFTKDNFRLTELEKMKEHDPSEKVVAYMNFVKYGGVKLNTYNHNLQFYSTLFPDCGATALRNFFKLALYDSERNIFDVSYKP